MNASNSRDHHHHAGDDDHHPHPAAASCGVETEGSGGVVATGGGSCKTASSSPSMSWLRLKDPRIVRASRAFGGKDRHSKVCTVKGLRDRRVRLSVPTAIQLYDLQDRLGLSQPSKVVDWLLNAAKDDIDELPPLQIQPADFIRTSLLSLVNKAGAGINRSGACNTNNNVSSTSTSTSTMPKHQYRPHDVEDRYGSSCQGRTSINDHNYLWSGMAGASHQLDHERHMQYHQHHHHLSNIPPGAAAAGGFLMSNNNNIMMAPPQMNYHGTAIFHPLLEPSSCSNNSASQAAAQARSITTTTDDDGHHHHHHHANAIPVVDGGAVAPTLSVPPPSYINLQYLSRPLAAAHNYSSAAGLSHRQLFLCTPGIGLAQQAAGAANYSYNNYVPSHQGAAAAYKHDHSNSASGHIA